MLQMENDLRLSAATQHRYADGGMEAYVEITLDVQRAVAKEFGLSDALGVQLLQCALSLSDLSQEQRDEINTISFYRKFNRMRDGTIGVGDMVPAVAAPLYTLDREPVAFSCLLVPFRPTVLIAASIT